MAPKRKVAAAPSAGKKAKRDVVRRASAPDAAAAAAPKGKGVTVGAQFPDLGPLETDEGKMVDLKDILAETGVLLFSYPKANTGGCTAQATGHNEQAAAYAKKGFKVYGISADKPTSQANWRAKHGFNYNLLCDPTFTALKALGWTKDGGKAVARSHAVIAKGGKVLDAHSPISPKDSVALGLEFIEAL